MYPLTFELKSFEASTQAGKVRTLLALLEALIASNMAYLEVVPNAPMLYNAGIRYTPDEVGDEKWKDIPQVLATRAGNCKEFASWRVAELRARGDDLARPIVVTTQEGPRTLFHIVVRRGDGIIEDPSRILGMPEPT